MRRRSSETLITNCSGPSRRAFMRIGLGASVGLGLGLSDLFRLQAIAADPSKPGTPQLKHVILVWLAGGASHIDTFDPKPEATPDVRGEFKPIDTSVPGVKISEVFPKLAKVMDQLTLIRSVTSPEADHDRAAHHLLTGYRPSPALVYPSYGSVVAKMLETQATGLPNYVAMPDSPAFANSGYLTPAFDPFAVEGDPNQDGFRVRNLTPPDRLTLERLKRRRDMVRSLDRFAKDVPATPLTGSRDKFTDRAYDLLTSSDAQKAFRIGDEPTEMREKYGRNPVGQSFLLSRRLIEAGVPFVTINDRGAGLLGWDTHQQNFPTIKNALGPPIDQGLSTLVQDLTSRGLIDKTLILMIGEFGRTPKINQNAGRDHHGRANCAILAGAGMPRGRVIGKTDARGDSPTESPVTPADLAATLFQAIGIDPNHQFESPDGRRIRLVDGGKPIPAIFGGKA